MTDLITPDPSGAVPVAHVKGEIDLANAAQLRSEALELVAETGTGIVLDLADVPYLDSAGIWVLFDLARELKRRGQDLAVSTPPDAAVRRLLKITHFDEAGHICESVAEAVQILSGPTDT